nr:MAG TPA: homing endonuclease [Caudoviricetes sp.]
MKLCSFPGCNKKHCAKGLCNSHWAQVKRQNKLTPIRTNESIEDRFYRQIVKEKDGCWTFVGNGKGSGKGASLGRGYGQIYYKGQKQMAHRWSYEHFISPLNNGDQVDHLCRNTRCVNPDHLEAVSQYENMRRLRFAQVLNKKIERLENFIQSLGYDPNSI